MVLNVFSRFVRAFLRVANIQEANFGGLPSFLGSEDLQDRILANSIMQSISEMVATSGRFDYDEEHQTSSLMGHLTTGLTWFSLAGILSAKDEAEAVAAVPDIRWAGQSKHQEANSGVDFGVAVNLGRDEDGDEAVRLTLFQAKKVEKQERGSVIDVGSIIRGRASKADGAAPDGDGVVLEKKPDHSRKSEVWKESKYFRSEILHAFGEKSESEKKMKDILAGVAPMTTGPRFQLEAFARTFVKGLGVAKTNGAWCHYVAWYGPKSKDEDGRICLPKVLDVSRVLRFYSGGTRMPGNILFEEASRGFSEVLFRSLSKQSSDYGIVVALKDVPTLISELCELMPGLRLLLSSDDSEGGKALACACESGGMSVTESLSAAAQLVQLSEIARFQSQMESAMETAAEIRRSASSNTL